MSTQVIDDNVLGSIDWEWVGDLILLRAVAFLQFTPPWPSTRSLWMNLPSDSLSLLLKDILPLLLCSALTSFPCSYKTSFPSPYVELRSKSRRHPGAVIPSWVFTKALPAFAAVSSTFPSLGYFSLIFIITMSETFAESARLLVGHVTLCFCQIVLAL